MATFEDFNELLGTIEEGAPLNAIWLRARGYCEYCGTDLLELHEIYRGAEGDHILQQRRYPKLINKLNNYVMACASCHKLKGNRFDPGAEERHLQEADDITDVERERLIGIVKDRIAPRRDVQKNEMLKAREFIRRHFPNA